MQTTIKTRKLVLSLVPLLVLVAAGCNRGHNDNVQSNGPDQLPLRLQLPKDTAAESFRILQYAPDNVTRQAQQSVMRQGPYAGGRQLRIYDSNNNLSEIRIYYQGSPERLGYHATFSEGQYDQQATFAPDGSRQSEGHRLADGTFDVSTYYPGGRSIYKHAIFGRLMNSTQKLEWKLFGHEVYRQDNTLAAVQQRMDDGGTFTQFFDEKHVLTETLFVDKAGTALTETDFRADGKTPLTRIDFNDKMLWTFDEKGQLTLSQRWLFDQSLQVTVFKAGVPQYTQDWEIDKAKSDTGATPAKIVFYLSWVTELRSDGSVATLIDYWAGTRTVKTITVYEVPPKDAKLKPFAGLTVIGSSTPVKNWTPPAKTAAASAPPAASVVSTAGAPPATPAVSPFWTASGGRTVYSYSKNGYLTSLQVWIAGQLTADKTVVHKESEHIRARVSPTLLTPMPPADHSHDKPKDPTPAISVPAEFDPDID